MNALPPSPSQGRSPRLTLAHATPAVLRFADGRRSQADLQVVSLTGGLLNLPKPLAPGALVTVIFLLQNGAVLGAAEMLRPASWSSQPFRFLALGPNEQRRLRAAIQATIGPAAGPAAELDDAWIERYRANLSRQKEPKRRFFRAFFAAVALSILGLGSAAYLYGTHLK